MNIKELTEKINQRTDVKTNGGFNVFYPHYIDVPYHSLCFLISKKDSRVWIRVEKKDFWSFRVVYSDSRYSNVKWILFSVNNLYKLLTKVLDDPGHFGLRK